MKCTAGERWSHVGITFSAWRRTKGPIPQILPQVSFSHMRRRTDFSSTCFYLSGVVGLFQVAAEANCAGSRQTASRWCAPLASLSYYLTVWNHTQSTLYQTPQRLFLSSLDPLIEVCIRTPHLCRKIDETLASCRLLPGFSSFSHNLSFSLAEGLSLNRKLMFHPNCVKLLRYAVNNAGNRDAKWNEDGAICAVFGTTCMSLYGDANL